MPNMRSTSGGMDVECRLEAPVLKELLAYWQRRRPAADRLPGRAHIDPVDIPALLPHIFLVDVQRAPRIYRYRLFGTELADSYGRDITGKAVDELFTDVFRKAVTLVFNHVVDHRAPLRTYGTMAWREKHHLRFEAVQMPLAADGAAVDMILGAVVYR
ncbi:MAG TPA: PAS domain-containing protein [Stellaceae bacterium]|nr:PAS domain-containing protein [Stellaceae bacterium]